MSTEKPMTLEEIRRVGLEALRRDLGLVGMIRFLQIFETGHGDYTAERHQWLDQMDLDAIMDEIGRQRERGEARDVGSGGDAEGVRPGSDQDPG
jgi:hypothetical protein